MADDKNSKTNSAQKVRQAADARKAMLDYEAEAAAVRAKTERLRALRLARDAAMPPPPPRKAPARKPGTARKSKPKPLSDWLEDQKKDGLRD
jgi:hypothetical protein